MPPKRVTAAKAAKKPVSPAKSSPTRGTTSPSRAAAPAAKTPTKAELKTKLAKCRAEKKAKTVDEKKVATTVVAPLVGTGGKVATTRKAAGKKSEARQLGARKYREGGSYVAFYSQNFTRFYKPGDKVSAAAKAAGAEWRSMPVSERVKYQVEGAV